MILEPVLLLVDDEENVLAALKRVFVDDNYKILTANSASEGLKLLENNTVQIIISDQRMPVMTGSEFFAEVRKLYPETIRILLTGYSDFDAIKDAINKGNIYKYLTKPWNNTSLQETVKDALKAYLNQNKSKEIIAEEAKAETTRLQNEFLTNMSHEIRTPLNVILGYAKILDGGMIDPNSAQYKQFLQNILANSQEFSYLLVNILDLAQLQSNKIEFNPESVDLVILLNEVKAMFNQQISTKEIKFEINIDPSLTHIVKDHEKLKKVICHYVSNAIKFSKKGGKVEITAHPESENQFRINVKDDGIGIREKEIKDLFIPFKQLDMSTTKEYRGAGLGLAITQRIVEAQGGKVGVESIFGKGSTFYLILPCA